MKDNEVNYLFNAFKNHAADDSVNTRSDESCQSLNAKYGIANAELDLEVTILTASLHKEQEKVVSHSVRIGEIEKQIQNLIADNNKQTAQSVREKVAINMPSPEYKLPTNNVDKSNQNEGVTLNSQKSRVESNMSVIDYSNIYQTQRGILISYRPETRGIPQKITLRDEIFRGRSPRNISSRRVIFCGIPRVKGL